MTGTRECANIPSTCTKFVETQAAIVQDALLIAILRLTGEAAKDDEGRRVCVQEARHAVEEVQSRGGVNIRKVRPYFSSSFPCLGRLFHRGRKGVPDPVVPYESVAKIID